MCTNCVIILTSKVLFEVVMPRTFGPIKTTFCLFETRLVIYIEMPESFNCALNCFKPYKPKKIGVTRYY